MATKLVNREMFIDVMTRFLCVRVVIAADEPLKQSLRVDIIGSGKVTTMLLRYERLPYYCFKCGRLSHTMIECSMEGEERNVKLEASLRLGMWL
ncbi:hypothetical protein EZV62_012453 [Acer yangbiense]|uniref:Zinc knuckle CX2CX4HX4C domain-containing protein n=1 Tax=Acer yangbiense TaxID=1000413 RepID=A0A5C7HVX0_9ROSI|nr:hypothetical protein EZV62_012453 [Acer yangbiense]